MKFASKKGKGGQLMFKISFHYRMILNTTGHLR